MSFNTERTGNGLITVSPKDEGDQSALVVISHGLGDTAEGFADVAEVRIKRESKSVYHSALAGKREQIEK